MADGAVHPSLVRHVPSYASKPSARSAGATLVTLKDGREIGSVALDSKSCYSLGRNAEVADVAVEHALASRAHCLLAWDQDGRIHLVDLDSTHGTQLGGQRLGGAGLARDVVLRPGQPFRVADSPAEYVLEYRERGDTLRQPSTSAPQPGPLGFQRASGQRSRSRSPVRAVEVVPPVPRATVSTNAAEAAELVLRMMGGVASAGMGGAASADQKRKLLWAGKKQAAAATAPAVIPTAQAAAACGSNRWDAAEFTTQQDKDKFLRLMGGAKAGQPAAVQQQIGPQLPGAGQHAPPGGPGAQGAAPAPEIMRRDAQQRVLSDLEREFQSGMARRMGHNKTVGLGL